MLVPPTLTLKSDHELKVEFEAVVQGDRDSMATFLWYLAEVDSRKLYVPLGYSSLYKYLVNGHRLSADAAVNRSRGARILKRYPYLYEWLSDGALNLTALILLRPNLTRANARELFEAACGCTNDEIRRMLAERFPRADMPTRVIVYEPIELARPMNGNAGTGAGDGASATALANGELLFGGDDAGALTSETENAGEIPGRVDTRAESHVNGDGSDAEPQALDTQREFSQTTDGADTNGASDGMSHAAMRVIPSDREIPVMLMDPLEEPGRVRPLSARRYALEVTIGQLEFDSLCRARELLMHAVPSGSIARVVGRALIDLVTRLEKLKFAETKSPREGREALDPRTIPAEVRRAVSERDGRQCTFRSDDGTRCDETAWLEFDHIVPVARGGKSVVENIRLRCRAHNQYEADRAFGEGFMRQHRVTSH